MTVAAVATFVPVLRSSAFVSAAPLAYTPVARDTFSRVVATGVGRADTGQSWQSVAASKGTSVRVDNGRLAGKLPGPGTSWETALTGVSLTDVMVEASISVPAFTDGGLYYSLSMRRRGDGSQYRVKVQLNQPGRVAVTVVRTAANGAETLIATSKTAGFALTAGTRLHVQGQAYGSAVTGRIWLQGSAVPAWQAVATDRTITSGGGVGQHAWESSRGSAATFTVDDYAAYRITGGAAPASSPSPEPPVTSSPATSPAPPTSPVPSTSSAPSPAQLPSTSPAPPSSTTAQAPPTSVSVSVPAVPAGRPQPARGSAELGSTSYEVPSDALFVAPEGSDTAAGTVAAPLRTVARALATAPSGATVVLRAGVYHEGNLLAQRAVTLQSYPGETVWFDGSTPVTTWVQSGATWVASGWTPQFRHWESFSVGSNAGGFVNPAHPYAAWPDQVFIDGVQLDQVGSGSTPGPGQFAVDYAAHTLRIGSDPSGRDVRASDLSQLFVVSVEGFTLRGVGVRRYATSLTDCGAIYLARPNSRVENVVMTDIATQAIVLYKGNAVLDHVTIRDSGMNGVTTNQSDGSVISNSVITRTNREHFNATPSAGGIKLTRTRHVSIVNNDISDNHGVTGVWLDQSVVDFVIANNTVSSNGDVAGIEVEISDTGIVANNVVTGGDRGVYVLDSGNVQIYNNRFAGNWRGSVFLSQDERRESLPGDLHDPRQPIPDPTCPWLTRNITISNNIFEYNGPPYGYQVWALDYRTNIPASAMNIVIDGNRFHTKAATSDTMVAWGRDDNTVTSYKTPGELNQGLGTSWLNSQVPWNDPGAQSADVAKPLPADVAAAVGVPTGTRHLGPFL